MTLQPSYVLHQRQYRDSSRLVDCLCRDHGRVALVARGVRRPKSKLRSVLMPFQPVLVSWVRRTDLGTLTSAEGNGAPVALGPDALMAAYYVNELVLRLVQSREPQEDVFALYEETLRALTVPDGTEIALRRFEKRLLDALGYGLSLAHESNRATPVDPDVHYHYRTDLGPVRAAHPHNDPTTVSGAVLAAIDREQFDDPDVLRCARVILREALAVHLGSAPLRVREVARAMARPGRASEAEGKA